MADTPTTPVRPTAGQVLDLSDVVQQLSAANTPAPTTGMPASPGSQQPNEGIAPGPFSTLPATPFPSSFTKPGG